MGGGLFNNRYDGNTVGSYKTDTMREVFGEFEHVTGMAASTQGAFRNKYYSNVYFELLNTSPSTYGRVAMEFKASNYVGLDHVSGENKPASITVVGYISY